MNICNNFATRRIALKLSQSEIAEKLNVDQSTISRIENGNNDRFSLHVAYNGLLNELEEGVNNGKKES